MNKPQTPNPSDLGSKVPESMHPVLEWMSKNRKILVTVVSVVVLVVAGYSGWKVWDGHAHNKAQTELGEILMSPVGPERTAALEEFVARAPEKAALRGRVELAGAYLAAEEYDKAATAFADLAKAEDPDIKAMAGMGQARALLLDGKAAEATDLLNALKPGLPEDYAMAATHLLAVAAEAAGEIEIAAAAYQELLNSVSAGDAEYILYKLNQLSGEAESSSDG